MSKITPNKVYFIPWIFLYTARVLRIDINYLLNIKTIANAKHSSRIIDWSPG